MNLKKDQMILQLLLVFMLFSSVGHAESSPTDSGQFSMFRYVRDVMCGDDSSYPILKQMGVCDLQYTQHDVSTVFLSDVFGNVGGALPSGSNQVLGQMFYIFNSALLIIISIFTTYVVMSGVVNTARDGVFLGQQKGSVFLIVRTMLGLLLIIPRSSGYCVMQVLIMYTVMAGVNFANLIWGFAEMYYYANGNSFIASEIDPYAAGDEDLISKFLSLKFSITQQQELSRTMSYLWSSNVCQGYYESMTEVGGFDFEVSPLQTSWHYNTYRSDVPYVDTSIMSKSLKKDLKKQIFGKKGTKKLLPDCGRYLFGATDSIYRLQSSEGGNNSQYLTTLLDITNKSVREIAESNVNRDILNNLNLFLQIRTLQIYSIIQKLQDSPYKDVMKFAEVKKKKKRNKTTYKATYFFPGCANFVGVGDDSDSDAGSKTDAYACYMELLPECFKPNHLTNENINKYASAKVQGWDYNLNILSDFTDFEKTGQPVCGILLGDFHNQLTGYSIGSASAYSLPNVLGTNLADYVKSFTYNTSTTDTSDHVSAGWAMAGALFSIQPLDSGSSMPNFFLSMDNIASDFSTAGCSGSFCPLSPASGENTVPFMGDMMTAFNPQAMLKDINNDNTSELNPNGEECDFISLDGNNINYTTFGTFTTYLNNLLQCYTKSLIKDDSSTYTNPLGDFDFSDIQAFSALVDGLNTGALFKGDKAPTRVDQGANVVSSLPLAFFGNLDGFTPGPVPALSERWAALIAFFVKSWFLHFADVVPEGANVLKNTPYETIMTNPFIAIQQFGAKMITGAVSFIILGMNDVIESVTSTVRAFRSLTLTLALFEGVVTLIDLAFEYFNAPFKSPFTPGPYLGPGGTCWPFCINVAFDIAFWLLKSFARVLTIMFSVMAPLLGQIYQTIMFQKLFYLPLYASAVTPLILLGGIFSIYIPLLPMLIYSLTVVNWLVNVFELMIAAPIVALGIAYPVGHDLLGQSSKLMTMFISALVRPLCIVIGFVISVILAWIALSFFAYLTSGFMGQLFTAISIPDTFSFNSLSSVQQIMVVFILLLYCYIALAVMSSCFSFTYLLPYSVMRWVDPSSMDSNQAEAEEVQEVFGGFTGILSKVADAGSQYLSQGQGFSMDASEGLSHRLEQVHKQGTGSMATDNMRQAALGGRS